MGECDYRICDKTQKKAVMKNDGLFYIMMK